jgi:hypothetical protein
MEPLDPNKRYVRPWARSDIEQLKYWIYFAAGKWYTTYNPKWVKQYHDAYHKLRSLDWDGAIDIEAELPEDLMPQDYLERAATAKAEK